MLETDLWKKLNRTMKPYWTAVRIETARIGSSIPKGFPDIFWSIGQQHAVMELKQRREWPKRVTTPVTFDHFTKEQRLFFIKHRGLTSLLIRVDETIMFFKWQETIKVGTLTKQELLHSASGVWENEINAKQLVSLLIQRKLWE